MKKSFKFLFFGAGPNQYNFIKHSIKKKNYNIVIHNKKKIKEKKFLDEFIYGSVYKKTKIISLLKKIKNNKNLDDIICRSSGPSIISAYKADKYFGIGRVDRNLAYCVYSKFFLYKFLKKNRIPVIRSTVLKRLKKKIHIGSWVIKPDAPIVGKKFVYKIENQNIKKNKFLNVKKSSDNKLVNISEFIPGRDISAIFFIKKKNKKRILLNLINEWNFFYNNQINLFNIKSVAGISTPPLKLKKTTLAKIKKILNKVLKLFPNYYGLFVVSLRVNKDKIYVYEINLNMDSKYSKIIFPNFFNKKSIFDLEINNLMNLNLGKFGHNKNKFLGILGKNLIKDKFKYLNKIQKYGEIDLI